MAKKKLYPHKAGNTLEAHEKILKKLKKKGAEIVEEAEESDVIIVFCPIASRYETDVGSALSGLPETWKEKKVVLVAMHHTFDPNYTLPSCKQNKTSAFLVDCLFYEKTGLLKCECNKKAIKKICKELKINVKIMQKIGKKIKQKPKKGKKVEKPEPETL